MKDFTCKNCGSSELTNENGILICQSCGSKYMTNTSEIKSTEESALDRKTEESRIKEIEKILELTNKGEKLTEHFVTSNKFEDKFSANLLTDEDILKYAPRSYAGYLLKKERGEVGGRPLQFVDFETNKKDSDKQKMIIIAGVTAMILFFILVPLLVTIFCS